MGNFFIIIGLSKYPTAGQRPSLFPPLISIEGMFLPQLSYNSFLNVHYGISNNYTVCIFFNIYMFNIYVNICKACNVATNL